MDISQFKVVVSSEEVEPCVMKVQVELPAERADAIYAKVRASIAAKAKLPGFRAGKLPATIIDRQLGPQIKAEAMDTMLNEAYKEAVQSLDFADKITNNPKLADETPLDYVAGKPFTFAVTVECYAKYDLPNYKGLELTKEIKKVTDEDIQKQIASFAEMATTYEETDKPAAANDMLQLSYEATIPEGLVIPDTASYLVKAENTWLGLRTPEMLPGCTQALTGISKGEEKDIQISFPTDFDGAEELKGQTLTYHVSVKTVRSEIKPEINDDFAKRMGFETLAKVEEVLRTQMEAFAEKNARNKLAEQITDYLLTQVSFALPPTLLENSTASTVQAIMKQKQREGVKEEELKAQFDEIKAQGKEEAIKSLRTFLLLCDIAEAEKIELTQGEIIAITQHLCESEANKKAGLRRAIQDKQKSGELQNALMDARLNKVIDKIIELGNVTEKALEEA